MAYKFQLGSAVLSGSVSQEGSIKVLDDSGNEKGSFTSAGALSASAASKVLSLNINSSTAAISSAGAYTGASVDVSGKVDGATGFDVNGTNIVDSSRNVANVGTLSGSGAANLLSLNVNSSTAAISSAGAYTGASVDVSGKVDGATGFDVDGTNVISSSRAIANVTTISGSGKIEGSNVDVDGKVDGKAGFDVNGTNVISSARAVGNVTTISGSGAANLLSVDINSSTAAISSAGAYTGASVDVSGKVDGATGFDVNGTNVIDSSRNIANAGTVSGSGKFSVASLAIDSVDVTATAAELNYVDIASLGTGAASKALVFDASKQFDGASSGMILSASIMSASNFYGDGSGLTGISSDNVDVTAKTDNVEYNLVAVAAAGDGVALVDVEAAGKTFTINASTGKISLAGDAALGTNDSDVVTIPAVLSASSGRFELSGNLGSTNYIKDWGGGAMATTESLGGKQVFGGYGSPYIHTKQISIPDIGASHNALEQKSSGQIHLSSSMASGDFSFPGLKFSSRASGAASLIEFEAKQVSFNLSTASVSGDSLEYFWSVESAHAADGEDTAWLNLDLSSSTKNFTVGGRDSIQLIANAGLQVNNSAAAFNAGLTSTTISASSTLQAGGGVTLQGLGNKTVALTTDVMVIGSGSSGVIKTTSLANYASALAGGSNEGLASTAGRLELDLNDLSAAVIDVSADSLAFIDADGSNGTKKESIADLADAFVAGTTNGLSASSGVLGLSFQHLGAGTVAVSADSMAFKDADDNHTKLMTIASFVSSIAGGGLTATNGVLATQAGSVAVVADGGTLAEGYNYLADISSNATVTLPSGSQGDVVHVKAADLNSGAVVIINCSGSQTIDDDHTSIRIESGFGAASLVYVAANKWRLV